MRVGRLWEHLRARFGFSREKTVTEAAVSSGVRSAMPKVKRTGYLNEEAFAGELVRIKDGDVVPQPHLHVFSLSDFRNAVGSKWERLGGLVEVAVESIIRRHVDTESDIFTRLDAEISCLALPLASRAETRTRVAAIARDISAHLFGDTVIDGRRPQVLAANLPLDDALTEEGEMDRVAIDHALAKAGAALAASFSGASSGMLGAALAAPHRASLASLMSKNELDQMAAKGEKKPVYAISGGERTQVKAPDWFVPDAVVPLKGADAPRQVLNLSSSLNGADAEKKAMAASKAASAQAADWFDPNARTLNGADAKRQVLNLSNQRGGTRPNEEVILGDTEAKSSSGLSPESALTLVWTPTWVTSRRAIGAFHARIIRSDTESAPTLEGVHAYDDLAPMEALTLDRFTSTQAARELKALFYSRQKIGLTVPVHWMSLSPKWRDVIRIPFEDCPAPARRKFLKIEVFGLNPSIPSNILRRIFEPLEKIGCDVMARLPISAVEMIPALSHLRAVGVDLAELQDDERVGDEELFARLEVFRTAAKKAKIASYVWGIRRRSLIAKVVASGFSLVNGPGVMCDLSHPELPSRGGRPD